MLASHALMLLGVPLQRVVKRIRVFRESRYKMFRGYFHGMTDDSEEDMAHQHERLHAVIVTADAYIIEKAIDDLPLDELNVEIRSIRRPRMNGAEINKAAVLEEGDVVVLLGLPADINKAETVILSGDLDGS